MCVCGTVLIFIFSTLGGGTPTVRSSGFSHWLRYNFRFFNSLSFFFCFLFRLLLFFFTGCVARCHKTCPLGWLFSLLLPQSVGVDFYLYLRSLVQHYTSKVGSGSDLVWFAWLKCYLPDRLTDWRTDSWRDRVTEGRTAVSVSAWLAGCLVGASLNRFPSPLFRLLISFRFHFDLRAQKLKPNE